MIVFSARLLACKGTKKRKAALNNSISVHTENVSCAIKRNLFLCFAFIHNVTLRVKGFRTNTPRNAKRARSAAFDKIRNVFH